MKHETIKLRAADAGRRLDVVLAELTGQSRSYWTSRLKAGKVSLNGLAVKASYSPEGGEVLEVEAEPAAQPAKQPKLQILYQDDDVIVIDKPAGLLTHTDRPEEPSVAGALAGEVEDTDSDRPGIVHRLDRDTSGILVVAKNPSAKAFIQAQFAARETDKEYLLLVCGTPSEQEALIRLPIGRSRSNPTSRTVARDGKPAVTRYKVLERFDGYSLLQAWPETGRTHQLRVHFRHIGHPVAGDVTYGPKQRPKGLARQFLHASGLSITLPTGRRKHFTSPLAPDLKGFLERLRKRV